MWLTIIHILLSVYIEIPVAWVSGHVRSRRCEDFSVVSFHLPLGLWGVRSFKIFHDGQHPKYVLEKLEYQTTTVFCYEFLRRTIVKDRLVDKVSGNFGGLNAFPWHCFRHLTELISDDEKILIHSLCSNELSEKVNAHGKKRSLSVHRCILPTLFCNLIRLRAQCRHLWTVS